MSESVKPRIAVDLNEIERQLASAQAAPHAVSSTRNDPLAELARIVGQDDPFQSLLAGDRQARAPAQQQAPNLDDLFRASDIPAPQAPSHELRASVGHQHQAYDLDEYGQVPQAHVPQAYAYQQPQAPAGHGHPGYDDQADYDQGYYTDPGVDPSAYADEGDVRSLEPRRSRKGLMAVSAVVAAAVIGGGAAWYATGSSAMIAGGEPPVIKASAEPTKVQPDNPGGVEIPNQNKQIYERAKQTTDTKVVNREEQPVDVKEATRIASAGTAPVSTGATGAPVQAQAANALNLGEPKKVRTVAIRPDGTVANADAAPAPAAPAARPMAVPPPPAMTMPSSVQPAPPTIQTASAGQPSVPAARPAASTPAPAAKPVAAAATPSGTSPQRVASVQPTAPAEAAPEAAQAAVGGFSVQLGVRSSEGDAQKAFSQFQSKYSDLQGQPSLIRKAEVNGSTIYRVRVGPMSRDDASSLCSKLQGDGAQCFVAKN